MKTAKIGDGVYGVTNFPVVAANRIAIPPGTRVQGLIDVLSLPTLLGRAEMRLSFSTMVFEDGDATDFPKEGDDRSAIATFTVLVSRSSDVLLDNGTQIEFTLGRDLELPDTLPATRPMHVATWRSATRCVPTPGTPAVEGTVISGTSGTQDTVIPGAPGSPDIVIPGMPPTPPTIIGGSSGTAPTPCPLPPSISSELVEHKEAFYIKKAAHLGTQHFAAGRHVATWRGLGPVSDVEISGRHQRQTVRARVVGVERIFWDTVADVQADANGANRLTAIRFKGKHFRLQFD